MITFKTLRQLEKRLQQTDREIDQLIGQFFRNEPLSDFGDTANVVDLLRFQARLVEELAHAKIKLLRKHRE